MWVVWFAFLITMTLSGCAVWHLEGNSPGHVDLEERPSEVIEKTEVPEDPGEHVMLGWLAWSGAMGGSQEGAFLWRGFHGVELGLVYYEREVSHRREDRWDMFSARGMSHGLHAGWHGYEYGLDEGNGESRLGDWFLGYQLRLVGEEYLGVWVAGDLAVESGGEWRLGPQLTLSTFEGILFMRGSYLFGRGFSGWVGLSVRLPVAWVWSR